MFPLTLTLIVTNHSQLKRFTEMCAMASAQEVSEPEVAVAPSPKPAKIATKPSEKQEADVTASTPSASSVASARGAATAIAESTETVTYDQVKAAIQKAITAGKRPDVVATIASFKNVEGAACTTGPSIQAKDYPAILAKLIAFGN